MTSIASLRTSIASQLDIVTCTQFFQQTAKACVDRLFANCSRMASRSGAGAMSLPSTLITCQPNCVCTGVSEKLPIARLKAASQKLAPFARAQMCQAPRHSARWGRLIFPSPIQQNHRHLQRCNDGFGLGFGLDQNMRRSYLLARCCIGNKFL